MDTSKNHQDDNSLKEEKNNMHEKISIEQNKEVENETINISKQVFKPEVKSQDVIDVPITNNHRKSDDADKEMPSTSSSMVDVIMTDSHNGKSQKRQGNSREQTLPPENHGSIETNSSLALSVGSRVEAKDFGELWYPAQIMEVDYEEMEVLVHYDNSSKRHDEWIKVSSPRLRPWSDSKELISSAQIEQEIDETETKLEEKTKLLFKVGERCLARWKDNRRFLATIKKELDDGYYEIIFDDGFPWICNVTRLLKVKRQSDTFNVSSSPFDKSESFPNLSNLNISSGREPIATTSSTPMPATPVPYHKHLFDPTRDYLGPKSERRELKRKLNIKDLFNIGTTKRRCTKGSNVNKQNQPELKVLIERQATNMGTKPKKVLKTQLGLKKDRVLQKTEKKITKKDKTEDLEISEVRPETKSTAPCKTDEVFEDLPEIKLDSQSLKKETSDNIEIVSVPEVEIIKSEEAIDKIQEAITKLQDGLVKCEAEEKIKEEMVVKIEEENKSQDKVESDGKNKRENSNEEDLKSKRSRIKKARKLRLLREKRVKQEVEEVKNQLVEMKRQVEEMKKQVRINSAEALSNTESKIAAPKEVEQSEANLLLPGEWCCKWVNGHPQGIVSEVDCDIKVEAGLKPVLPRRSVQVEDPRLPPGWTKHLVRRSFGSSAGQWNVVLVSPDTRKFHQKSDMKTFMQTSQGEALKEYERGLLDFAIHRRMSRKLGWDVVTCKIPTLPLPSKNVNAISPILKTKKLNLKSKGRKKIDTEPLKKRKKLEKRPKMIRTGGATSTSFGRGSSTSRKVKSKTAAPFVPPAENNLIAEEGYVYVGSLKVQIIDNLLRCPADGCFKNFRNNTLLQMHIKHYHRELRKMMGATPKVLDLAYARTVPLETETLKLKVEIEQKTPKHKLSNKPKRPEPESKIELQDILPELSVATSLPTMKTEPEIQIPKSQDSPKLRNALISSAPVKRPKVLLPVRRLEMTDEVKPESPELASFDAFSGSDRIMDVSEDEDETKPDVEPMDFEAAISTHTVTKPFIKREKKKRVKALLPMHNMKQMSGITSEEDEWGNSDLDTRSSYPGSETPDSKNLDTKSIDMPLHLTSSESNEESKAQNLYITETGEKIKIVQMKREEIINCHCGFREEDGLMIQCELCLCWQHALCHNIQKESEVPEKYTCSICLNPRRGRRSQRFLHDQDRLYEGLLPGARPDPALRRAHELSGNLLRITDALHALRVKYYVATKKDHPKLYLWAKDWENGDVSHSSEERLNNEYINLNTMISDVGKENLPLKTEDLKDLPLMDTRALPSEEDDQRRDGPLVTQLAGLLSSPSGPTLDLPISTSELESLAKSVQECGEAVGTGVIALGPQPEAAIEDGACRKRLLRHVLRSQALIDARLDSIEAQIAELESQDPSFEDDETADYFPRTKQTIQMLSRDLDTMEELGFIS